MENPNKDLNQEQKKHNQIFSQKSEEVEPLNENEEVESLNENEELDIEDLETISGGPCGCKWRSGLSSIDDAE